MIASNLSDPVVVVVFEPETEGENLTLTEQVQQVFGPFDSDTKAQNWIHTFQQRCAGNWQFLICPLDRPTDIPPDPTTDN